MINNNSINYNDTINDNDTMDDNDSVNDNDTMNDDNDTINDDNDTMNDDNDTMNDDNDTMNDDIYNIDFTQTSHLENNFTMDNTSITITNENTSNDTYIIDIDNISSYDTYFESDCPICFDSLDNNEIIVMDCCRKKIHLECIKEWYLSDRECEPNSLCLMCRVDSELMNDIYSSLCEDEYNIVNCGQNNEGITLRNVNNSTYNTQPEIRIENINARINNIERVREDHESYAAWCRLLCILVGIALLITMYVSSHHHEEEHHNDDD